MDGRNQDAQSQERSSYRIMSKRLPDENTFPVDHHADQPAPDPLEIGYRRMLELSVTVRTDNEQVTWMMSDIRVKVMYFKIRFAVAFFESERTKLTLPIV